MTKSLALLCVLVLGEARLPQPAGAQDTSTAAPRAAVLRLLIVDEETGDPVSGAIIRLKGRPDTTTGAVGRVEITGLQPKRWSLQIHAIGYEPRFESIDLQAGQVASLRFGLSFTGDKMPELVVSARNAKLYPRYSEFHRRMSNNLGYFVTWETILKRGYTSLGEALRGVRGVTVRCTITDCEISMTRSRACEPSFWVDGIEGRSFATSISIRDVYGIEVYRGSGETPGEYVGTGGCGAIVIWTKNKPYR